MIDKCAVAVIADNRLLLVKKRGLDKFIMPGGKRESGESDEACVAREVKEELNVESSIGRHMGTFRDEAYGRHGPLKIELYEGKIDGEPKPQQEIVEMKWFELGDDHEQLSPIVKNRILPFLVEKGMLKP